MNFLSLSQLKKSFYYAWSGLVSTYKSEQNFRLQVLVSIIVVAISVYFRLSRKEWVIVLLVICLVLLLELLNTALEKVMDILEPKIHHYVKLIKDVMAAAVFLASLFAVIIGVLIFWPYFFA